MAFYRCAGGTDPTGNAGTGDVLAGKTFSNADGIDKTGTMPSNANGTSVVSTGRDTTGPWAYIPYGYYPKYSNTNNSYVYFSDAQVVNFANKQEKTVTSSRSAQTVTPDSGKVLSKVTVNALAPTGTYKPTSRVNNNDMGATSNYRYVDTTAVPNSNSGTYTYAANSTGGTVDMGATNTYRYVNAANVYTKGKADGAKSYKSAGISENVWSVSVPANTISVVVCSTPFSPDITLGEHKGCEVLYNQKKQSGTYNYITCYTNTVVVKVDGSNRTVAFNHGETGYCTMSVASII